MNRTKKFSTRAFLDVPHEQKKQINSCDGTIRISDGIENAVDYIDDSVQALR